MKKRAFLWRRVSRTAGFCILEVMRSLRAAASPCPCPICCSIKGPGATTAGRQRLPSMARIKRAVLSQGAAVSGVHSDTLHLFQNESPDDKQAPTQPGDPYPRFRNPKKRDNPLVAEQTQTCGTPGEFSRFLARYSGDSRQSSNFLAGNRRFTLPQERDRSTSSRLF
jgi:hypothetical protein